MKRNRNGMTIAKRDALHQFIKQEYLRANTTDEAFANMATASLKFKVTASNVVGTCNGHHIETRAKRLEREAKEAAAALAKEVAAALAAPAAPAAAPVNSPEAAFEMLRELNRKVDILIDLLPKHLRSQMRLVG